MMEKIVTLSELTAAADKLRAAGKRLVVTNGCFDLLHLGHVRYLQNARMLGDVLIVALNGDGSVRKLKGAGRPINNERDRAQVLAALECVNFVSIFAEERATRFLETLAPEIYVKGGDYDLQKLDPEERAALEKAGTEIRFVPLESGYSTSALIEKLKISR